ncbi:MAG: uridine-cytidine kinase [Bacteroidia bacterium]|nr:uridine-cytidine kinase [Bacteroidia bacterium]
MRRSKPYIIGVAGGSASGKTTLIKRLHELYKPEQLCVISQDHYYRPLSEQQVDDNGEINFDLPQGIDFVRLARDVRKLKQGNEVQIVEYTFNNPNIFPKEITFKPAPVIVIEGLFIYTNAKLDDMFDLKLYVEAELEVMLQRRLVRDAEERGMTREQIEYQWNEHVLPAYENYLLPYRENVDLIIVNNTHFNRSFKVLTNHLDSLLSA